MKQYPSNKQTKNITREFWSSVSNTKLQTQNERKKISRLFHCSSYGDPFCSVQVEWHSTLMLCWQFSSVQLFSGVQLFATPWTAARQVSLSITNYQSPPKPMSIESVMPSNHLILCHPLSSCPQSLPASESFPMSQLFALGGQSIGVSASASVLPMSIQDWFPLEWTGLISLQSKELSRVFSNNIVQKHQFFSAKLSL